MSRWSARTVIRRAALLPLCVAGSFAAATLHTATAHAADYPGVVWVPASTQNYDVADRPNSGPIDMIIIHDTEGSWAGALQTFQNPAIQASAHYVIRSSDGAIGQSVAEKDIAWHAGNYPINMRAIGIEHEGYVRDPRWFTSAEYRSSAALSAELVRKYGIPLDRAHIIGHNEVPDPYNPALFGGWGHHTDPGPYWNWTSYMAMIEAAAGPPSVSVQAMPATASPTRGFTVSWARAANTSGPSWTTISVQDGSGPWLPWATPSTSTGSAVFHGLPGHAYNFVATAGNLAGTTAWPATAQAARTVAAGAVSDTPFTGMYAVDSSGYLRGASTPPLTVAQVPAPLGRGVAVRPDGQGAYVLDGWGGVHPTGTAPPVAISFYTAGWDIARAITLRSDGRSGWVLDGWGGVHAFGGAPAVTATGYWRGWDIARAMVTLDDGGGYVLDGWGGLHPFGDAPPMAAGSYWAGWDIARSVVLRPGGTGGYVLDGWGGVTAFGIAPAVSDAAYWAGWDIARAVVLNPGTGGGGWTVDGWGGFHPFGGAPAVDAADVSPAGGVRGAGIGGASAG